MTKQNDSLPHSGPLIEMATAYWVSTVLFTANRLGVFDTLSSGPLSLKELAGRCGARPESLALLLNACVSQRLLERIDGEYANTNLAQEFLVSGKETFLGDALCYLEDLYPVWSRLPETVVTNRPALPPKTILGSNKEKTRHFVLAMHHRALATASALADSVDLKGRQNLLDVGGGPGTYSVLLVKKTPGLYSTVLDLPEIVDVAEEIVAQAGPGERLNFQRGDYRTADFGCGRDIVLMSGILHRERADVCKTLFQKAFRSMQEDAIILASDIFFDDETKTSPPFATLFALNMRLTSQDGSAHARTEIRDWLAETGFQRIEELSFPPPLPHVLISGRKP